MASPRQIGKARQARKVAGDVELGFGWGPLNTGLLAAGVLVIALGYLTLHRGSITLAPVLLVVGYVVIIPASLVLRGRKQAQGE